MLPQVKQHIEKLGDEELVGYVRAGTAMYDAAAVAFAQEVLTRRGVAPERLAEITAVAERSNEVEEATISELRERPLGSQGRILAVLAGVIFGVGLPCLVIAWIQFRSRNECRKGRELWKFALMGFVGVWIILLILFMIPTSPR